ncbi:voltage-dependent anion-selective channel [Drosophila hydei]|uniref:Voltage-dependent anion-selective channel n=1 Tax=Drosophila hydei TaxID=7224 RepID=A0A6J1LYA3_DROHY|nr:voltage-dependent anion-selective channel [Drosophila hydei]
MEILVIQHSCKKFLKPYNTLELYNLFIWPKMVPPVYADLGKLARDLFRRGYHPGLWQLDCKTMTSSGIEFFTTGFASQDASKVMGSLQSKYNIEDYGITLTERWNTDNLLFGEIAQKDKLVEGLLLALEGRFQPSSGDKSGRFMARYAKDFFNILGKIDIKSDPLIGLSLVLSHNQFLAGASTDVDINSENIGWSVALGWTNETTTVHGELINADGWLLSVFHKANEQIDAAVEVGQAAAGAVEEGEEPRRGDLNVGVGMVYRLEGDALIRAKINSNVELGLGFQQKLREGITMSISTVLDCPHITDGNHKFGVGLSLEC